MRRTITTAALILLTATPAVAADEIGLSSDGFSWGSTLPQPLFDPAFRWVPGDRETASFWVRNQSGDGALLDQPPSAHTLTTPFFPLDLYQRDAARARQLAAQLGPDLPLEELAVRFALSHPAIASAIIGFGDPSHVDAAVAAMERGPLPADVLQRIRA